MMEKITQRTHDDCTICLVAMVMGPPYTYERVLQDSKQYPRADAEGHGLAWWKIISTMRDLKLNIDHSRI